MPRSSRSADRSPLPVELSVNCADRLSEAVEVAAFYVVSEALANVAKYSQATCAHITVTKTDAMLELEVVDDGIGGADPAAGSGLRGLVDRVDALDGRLEVVSPPGGGTRVRASASPPRTLARVSVTLLFTDIEGSTALVQELGDELRAASSTTHRRAVRDAIAAHGGEELDARGDEFADRVRRRRGRRSPRRSRSRRRTATG